MFDIKIFMGYKVVAPAGDNLKALFIGMKEFATEHVILITPENRIGEVKEICKKLKEFTISCEILEIEEENMMEEMFRIFGNLCARFDNDEIIVNVATGDKMSTCAALSAAFANGLKAIGVIGDKCMMMPIMKLSYYHELSESKLRILNNLRNDVFTSLNELSKGLGMSISLLSYHINGTYKHKGMKDFRLVEVKEENKNLLVKLSEMGKLLLKGYIKKK